MKQNGAQKQTHMDKDKWIFKGTEIIQRQKESFRKNKARTIGYPSDKKEKTQVYAAGREGDQGHEETQWRLGDAFRLSTCVENDQVVPFI